VKPIAVLPLALVLGGCGLTPAHQAASASPMVNPICDRLKQFIPQGGARRVWIEVRWSGQGIGDPRYGMQCTRSDKSATELCEWVVKNSSWEFPHALPMRILECVGYTFPRPFTGWKKWDAVIPVKWSTGGYSLLELNFSESTSALRFSGFALGQDERSERLPPLEDARP
jgi:hypothetical protein